MRKYIRGTLVTSGTVASSSGDNPAGSTETVTSIIGPFISASSAAVYGNLTVTQSFIGSSSGSMAGNFTVSGSLIASSSASVAGQLTAGSETVSGSLVASSSVSIAGALTLTNQVDLSSNGQVYIRFRPALDMALIANKAKPTITYRGIVRGFQLPSSSSDQELYFTEPYVPKRWDGATDITVLVSGYLDQAQASTAAYKLTLDWEHHTIATDTFSTEYNSVTVETAASSGAAVYKSFQESFTVDYDIDGGDSVIAGDILNMRLRRVAPSTAAYDVTGNVVITGLHMRYKCDKFGSSG